MGRSKNSKKNRISFIDGPLPNRYLEFLFSGIERTFPAFKTNCIVCKAETIHEKQEKILSLPDILFVNLLRFKRSKSNTIIGKDCKDVEPSIILTLDETLYSLNAVVTHDGLTPSQG